MFIGVQPSYANDEGNVITIGLDTQTVFYQPKAFYTGQNIQVLRHPNLNRYVAEFLVVPLKRMMANLNWGGNGATLTRLKRSKILLPSLADGTPDWQFMEEYMRQIEQRQLKPIINILCKRLINNELTGGGNCIYPRWTAFDFTEIFTISSGKRLTKADMMNGQRPFIGATESNNGVTEWVDNVNESLDRNVLGVNYNGSVCETFYHPYECIFSDDVKRLHLKKGIESRYTMLFLKTMILKQKCKYTYGYKFNENRMKRQKLLLPITEKGEIDFAFMASFMRGLETNILGTTIKAFAERINVNKYKHRGG